MLQWVQSNRVFSKRKLSAMLANTKNQFPDFEEIFFDAVRRKHLRKFLVEKLLVQGSHRINYLRKTHKKFKLITLGSFSGEAWVLINTQISWHHLFMLEPRTINWFWFTLFLLAGWAAFRSHNNTLIYAGTRRSHIAPFVSLISIGISRSQRPRAISHKAHLGAIYVFNFHYTNGEELASIIPRMYICMVDKLDPPSLICHFVVNLLLLVSKVFIMRIFIWKIFRDNKKVFRIGPRPNDAEPRNYYVHSMW